MSSGQVHRMSSDRETARTQARANLLLALYSHVSHDLEQTRADGDLVRSHLSDTRREFEAQLSAVRSELELARKEVERLHWQLHETNNERQRVSERLAHLEQEHAAVLSSTSWRITAPIRAVI